MSELEQRLTRLETTVSTLETRLSTLEALVLAQGEQIKVLINKVDLIQQALLEYINRAKSG